MNDSRRSHIIVIGNEKGGSGKSTTAVHLAVALAKLGFGVGAIDLDARQGTMSRYFENRRRQTARTGQDLPSAQAVAVPRSDRPDRAGAEADETERFDRALGDLAADDYIVIDTPGSDSHLSRLGHARADTLLTPLNDSLIDLDLFARIDGDSLKIDRASCYADMVWEQRKRKFARDGRPLDWVVARNRMATGGIDSRNRQQVGELLPQLGKRYGFRVGPGFGERVIYRELFLKGLTLLDKLDGSEGQRLSLSHVAARAELRGLVEALRLPGAAGRTGQL